MFIKCVLKELCDLCGTKCLKIAYTKSHIYACKNNTFRFVIYHIHQYIPWEICYFKQYCLCLSLLWYNRYNTEDVLLSSISLRPFVAFSIASNLTC